MQLQYQLLVVLAGTKLPCVAACKESSTLLRQLLPGMKPMVEVKINDVPRQLVIDTGSADTTIFTKDTKCFNGTTQVNLLACSFSDLYYGPYEPIDSIFFKQNYGGNAAPSLVSGSYGYATVEVAGLVLEKQRIAFANRTNIGQPLAGASGILGLAPRLDEAIYSTANPPQNDSNNYNTSLDYPNVFESLYTRGHVEPLFSLAVEGTARGGYVTFGGLPPAPYNQTFTTVPLAVPLAKSYQYNILVDGISIDNKSIDNSSFQAIVDSGTPANLLPAPLAEQFNAAFDPPAKLNTQSGLYETTCNARQPAAGVKLGGTTFNFLQPLLVRKDLTNISKGCLTLVSLSPTPSFVILGSSFLENVVAVFDIGKEEMRFAAHEYIEYADLIFLASTGV